MEFWEVSSQEFFDRFEPEDSDFEHQDEEKEDEDEQLGTFGIPDFGVNSGMGTAGT